MNDFSIRVLYLHHNNSEATVSNYMSFVNYGNKITTIRDADASGIDGSWIIPDITPIPRGRRQWDSDTPLLNYVLLNYDSINETHILLCEWDCHCRCNLEELMLPFKDNDITVPKQLTEPDMIPNKGHFSGLYGKNLPLLKFAPSTFILVKKEVLLKICLKCKEMWEMMSVVNSESRLGTLANMCGYTSILFGGEISKHIHHFYVHFTHQNLVYHPVKKAEIIPSLFENTQQPPSIYTGTWEFGRNKDVKPFAKITLDIYGRVIGYKCFNEVCWRETPEGGLVLLNAVLEVTTKFPKWSGEGLLYGDFKDGKNWKSEWHWLKKIAP